MAVEPLKITAYQLAERYIGTAEIAGAMDSPLVMAMLRLDASWPENDEVPWCSAFVNWIAWHLRLTRSKSLAARSWLEVGRPLSILDAEPGFDVVILKRGGGNQPGPEVIKAQGHVAFFARLEGGDIRGTILCLGGNQGNKVSLAGYPADRLLGIRRIAPV